LIEVLKVAIQNVVGVAAEIELMTRSQDVDEDLMEGCCA